ncbi:YebC/PmpR family DNA-binding transcriptional regulator [bacterium]|nr:YebC/PmpR family DNA-binding transcriptional regulator [bacterium]
MSGHSKWSTIKRKKGKLDAARGKVFTKLIREITTAARNGGGDEGSNPRLRTALVAAKAANMPLSNIEKAIKKGTGELPGVVYEEKSYEGYGPGGVAIMIDTLTDNTNRTTAEVRHALTKFGGNLGETGCVAWMFESRGLIAVSVDAANEETLMDLVLEAGADDFSQEGDVFEVITMPDVFDAVKSAVESSGIEMLSSELTKIPQNTIKVEGKQADVIIRVMDLLDDIEDVQQVYANFDMDDE